MAIAIGQQLGSYEITAMLGKGGMGEVYRARDTKLKRDVAIKILPDEFSRDPERVIRFQREAEALAALNHPNIAAIYDLQDVAQTRFLVLELVDGETVAERLACGPLQAEEATLIAHQIAEALEAAHEKGVIHRDLKPGNIKITPEGQVKVLDFGLAKILESDGVPASLSASPTMISVNPSYAGVILGTAAYMSPEQSRGKLLDRRADIWAFGCVLFEMLTGKQAFEGETVTDVFAAILKSEPDWAALPASTSETIRRVLRQCLQKDPRRRLQHIGDARIAMEDAVALSDSPVSAAAANAETQNSARPTFWIATTVVLLLLSAIALFAWLDRSVERPHVVKFFVNPPERGSFASGVGEEFTMGAISPDGLRLAFTAKVGSGKVLLWARALDSLTAQSLAGTDDAFAPFWSPDSRSIAFFAQGRLKRVDVGGGPPQNLVDAATSRGGTWNRDNVILFVPVSNGSIFRVAAAGGQPVQVTKLSQGQISHRSPSFLPDGRHFLYYALGSSEVSGVFVGTLGSEESKRVVASDTGAIYSPSGDLLFVRQGTLLRQHFDLAKLETTGDASPIAESISAIANIGAFSISDDGVLAYRSGASGDDMSLAWVDRAGKLIGTMGSPGPYRGFDISPDGSRVAVHRHDATGGDVWVFESVNGPMSRQTFDPSRDNSSPIWSPDAKRIAFGAVREGRWGIYIKIVDGGAEDLVFEMPANTAPMSWSPDGNFILLRVVDPKTGADEWILSLKDKKAMPLLHDPANELRAQISPDGKWIAYESTETGRAEIYLKAFPSADGKRQVTGDGGRAPRWSGDGKELFFLRGTKINSVKVAATGSSLKLAAPEELFDSRIPLLDHSGGSSHFYAVSPDGKRFLIPLPESASADIGAVPITVVANWLEELKKRGPLH